MGLFIGGWACECCEKVYVDFASRIGSDESFLSQASQALRQPAATPIVEVEVVFQHV